MRKIISILAIVLLIVILFVGSCAGYVWYQFFDTGTLVFYDNEPIQAMFPYGDMQYFITADGYGYVCGGYSTSNMRTYRNVEGNKLNGTHLTVPVRLADLRLRDIIPYSDNGALLITDSGELYIATDKALTMCCENVQSATYNADLSLILYIDTNNVLKSILSSGETQTLRENVCQVLSFKEQVFFLEVDGTFCSAAISNNGTDIDSTEVIYENVRAFSVNDASMKADGDKVIVDSQDTMNYNNALFVVLLQNGDVYCRGKYHSWMGSYELNHDKSLIRIENEWHKIGSEIETISSSAMGTVMLGNHGDVYYYGYDTTRDEWIGFHEIELKDQAVAVAVENSYVCILLRSGEWLFWGDSWSNQFCGVGSYDRVVSSIKKDNASIFKAE